MPDFSKTKWKWDRDTSAVYDMREERETAFSNMMADVHTYEKGAGLLIEAAPDLWRAWMLYIQGSKDLENAVSYKDGAVARGMQQRAVQLAEETIEKLEERFANEYKT